MNKTAAVLLADGFEEIEALAIIDVLRRAGVRTSVLGAAGPAPVRGAHDVVVSVDAGLEDADASALDLVALPGGMPGAANLAGNQGVLELVRRVYDAGGLAAAICAAPWVLDRAGVLKGRRATCYPTFEDRLTTCAVCTGARVEVDGRIITGRGPGPAIEFALALVTALGAPGKAAELRRGMLLD